jgi:hypothetical protein
MIFVPSSTQAMISNWKTWLKCGAITLVAAILIFFSCSPYRHYKGFDYRLIRTTVQINASADSVFRFLGNSANARKWSVFVDHISPLNNTQVPDGKVGSRRRCFCQSDEKGRQWDEVVTEVIPGVKRQISCYNLLGFPLNSSGLATEQLYTPLGPEKCELSFTLFFLNKKPSLWDEIKIRAVSYTVKNIFSKNMDNIKHQVENGN